jgi:hypothetical protein
MLNRFVGDLAVPNGKEFRLDVSELTLRLLLTDKVILDTHRLSEVNDLAAAFGVKGLMALFEAGKLSLTCEAFSFGFQDARARNEHEFPLVFVWGASENRETYLRTSIGENIKTGGGMVGLKRRIHRYIEEPPGDESAALARNHLHTRLMNDPDLLRHAIVQAGRATGLAPDLDLARLDVTIEQCIPETLHYRITSNLPSSLSVEHRRKLLSGGISAIATTALRLDGMKRHDALTESKETDLPILEAHLRFLEKALSKGQPIEQLKRTLTLTGATMPSEESGIDARRLIDAAQSSECLQFRKWLQTEAPNRTDDEIERYFGSWSAKYLGGRAVQILKFITLTAAPELANAVLPGSGLVLGPALSVLDTFYVDKVIRPGGPVLFLNQTYPSIFEVSTKGRSARSDII